MIVLNLNFQLPQDKWQDEEQLLKARCQVILDDISDDPNLSKNRANEMLSDVSANRRKIDEARHLAAVEIRRAELRTRLSELVSGLLRQEVGTKEAPKE